MKLLSCCRNRLKTNYRWLLIKTIRSKDYRLQMKSLRLSKKRKYSNQQMRIRNHHLSSWISLNSNIPFNLWSRIRNITTRILLRYQHRLRKLLRNELISRQLYSRNQPRLIISRFFSLNKMFWSKAKWIQIENLFSHFRLIINMKICSSSFH